MFSIKEYLEMRTILAQEHRRRTIAMTILWNMIVERLSDDTKELLLASPEFTERKLVEEKRIPAALLRILKEIVTGGITTDPTYQMVNNVKSLHS
jgi:phosphoenolpyruvate synthase/pyruvate phosphate dikinase